MSMQIKNKNIYLKELDINFDNDIYEMLQRIQKNENEFKNDAFGLNKQQFREWLIDQYNWSKGMNLPNNYVPQTIYFLYLENKPIGIGKIRHKLTESSREAGGNIGYAIDPYYRGNGYATLLLKLLLKEASKLEIKEILLTVQKNNFASKKVIEKCGGKIVKENNAWWYFLF